MSSPSSAHDPARPPAERRERFGRGEVLFVTDRRFWRRSIGSEQRIAALVRHLCRRGVRVAVAYLGRIEANERARVQAFRSECPGLEVIERSKDRLGTLRSWWDTASRAGGTLAGRRSSPARRAFVHRTIAARSPRVVVIEFLRLANLVVPRPRAAVAEPLYWIDTHDLLHERTERYRTEGVELDHAIDAAEEIRALETFDAILAIQAREAEQLRRLLPSKPVLLVPHGISVPESSSSPPELAQRPLRLGFLGGRDDSNPRALDWFVHRVWPALRAERKEEVELHVAGQVCAVWSPPATEGIRIVGPIESIDAFWRGIDIAINPVRFGSGLKIKNVEALAYGCALLTTPIGAHGLEEASPEGLRIAEQPEDWLETLLRWTEDEPARRAMGARGRQFARSHLSEEAAFAALVARLEADLE